VTIFKSSVHIRCHRILVRFDWWLGLLQLHVRIYHGIGAGTKATEASKCLMSLMQYLHRKLDQENRV
jgi:hypothetical protein